MSNLTEVKLTPNLRFPEFTESWESHYLKEFFTKSNLRNGNRDDLTVLTNSATKGVVEQTDYFKKDIANKANLKNYYYLNINDFIYNPRISFHAPVGPMKRNKLKAGIVSPLYIVLTPQKGDLTFLEKYFESNHWHRYMRKISNYGARHDRMNITQEDLFKMPILIPSLKEQSKIGDFLSLIDRWLENLQAQKKALELYKKAMMQKIFSQETRFKDENGKDFPAWQEKKLKEIAIFKKGKGVSKDDITENGKYKCIRYGELYTKYSENIKDVVSYTNIDIKSSVLSKDNDILIPTSDVTPNGLATASALSEPGVILGGDILIIRSKLIHNLFFSYYITAHKKQILRLVSGVTVYHIYSNDLATLVIRLPCIKEQNKLAELLKNIDISIMTNARQQEAIAIWKKELIKGMFI